jgi:hypothetical protein
MSVIASGTGTGGTFTVPAGVPTGAVLYCVLNVPVGEFANEPAGLEAWSTDAYNFTVGGDEYVVQYEGFVHDGRSAYTWASTPSGVVKYVFVRQGDLADNEGVTFAYSYPGEQYPGSGRDPMEWGFIASGGAVPARSNLLVGYWSARDQAGSSVLFGIVTEDAVLTAVGADYRVGNTLAWPGNNSNAVEYDWTTNGFVIPVADVPRLRQRQRDDLRQRQADSRQLTARQRGYF